MRRSGPGVARLAMPVLVLALVPAIGLAIGLAGAPSGAAPPPNTTERVSVDYNGGDSNGWSNRAVLSPDGGTVLFASTASDLVEGPGAVWNLRDLSTGVTSTVPIGSDVGNPRLTGDGGLVVFDSSRSDLVPGDTNGRADVFVHDLAAGTTLRVSVDSTGAQFPAGTSRSAGITDDGRYVAFVTTTVQTASCQNNRVSVRDLVAGTTRIVQRCVAGAVLSGDGSALVVMSPSPDLGCGYALTHLQLSTSASTPIGCGTEPAISGNGRVVAYKSHGAGPLAGIQVFDVATGTSSRVDVADDGTPSDGDLGLVSSGPVLSHHGRVVVFAANATTLVPGDGSTADVYVRDLAAGTTRIVSVAVDGTPGDHESIEPAVSADGTLVSFSSRATDLVPAGDVNGQPDVYVRRLVPSACATATPTIIGTGGNDSLNGTPGNDVILGLGGQDFINGWGGNDLICGGGGQDHALFANSSAPVDVDLELGTATGDGSDALDSIEGAEGSRFNDRLKGSAVVNILRGGVGADSLSGFGANDLLDGGGGNDKLYGHAGQDYLYGGDGNDLLSGGLDVDTLDGGAGTDTCGSDATDTPVTACEG